MVNSRVSPTWTVSGIGERCPGYQLGLLSIDKDNLISNCETGGLSLTAFICRADESTLSRIMVAAIILLASSRGNPTVILKEAATAYKADTEAITLKVKQEFAAKEKAQPTAKST